jgi:DnaJ-class molecular chaperone
MTSEPCLICSGRGTREDATCAYCAGSGRVKVQAGGEKAVWQATGSCKVPAKKLILKESQHGALKA